MTYCIVNGSLTAEKDGVVSIQDRGFRYGDGLFETIAVHAGVPYQFEWHMQRLAEGLRLTKIDFNISALKSYCADLLIKNTLQDGLIRIQVTRGIGSKGYLPDPAHPQSGASFVIETAPIPAISHQPVKLWLSSYSKISPQALPVKYKLCQGLNSTLARIEAHENGCADALLGNEHGQLCETSSGNLFWFKNGTLYTPSLSCGVLSGSTRHSVLRLSPYPVIEAMGVLEILTQADAVFITNVVWQTLPVSALLPMQQLWNSASLANEFRELIHKDRELYSRQHRLDW